MSHHSNLRDANATNEKKEKKENRVKAAHLVQRWLSIENHNIIIRLNTTKQE